MKTIIQNIISILFLFLIVFQIQLNAQSNKTTPTQFPEPKFEHITIEDGLPENSIKCILQDHFGYLWLGTQSGLAKYDGYNMTVYQPDPDDSLSISNQVIFTIYEDRSGTLWIGTNGGLNRFDQKTETFTRYLHNPDDSTSINHNEVTSMYEDKVGNFWVGTLKGLNLFDRQNESFNHIYYQDSVYSPKVYDYLSSIKDNGKTISSILQVGDYTNLTTTFTINKNTIALIIVMYETGYGGGWLESANGDIIAGQKNNNEVCAGGLINNQFQIVIDTLNRGKYRLRYIYGGGMTYNFWKVRPPDYPEFWGIQVIELTEEQKNIQKILDDKKSALLNYKVRAILEDRLTGKLYVGSGNKILILDKEKKLLTENYNNVGLKYDLGEINSFYQSDDGSIWIGHSMGLSKFNPQRNSIKHYQQSPNQVFQNMFSHVTVDNDGFIWGGSGNGLVSFNTQNGQFKSYKNDPHNEVSISENRVWSVYKDRTGVLWAGTFLKGLNKWDRNRHKFKRFSYDSNNPNSERFKRVLSIIEDSEGIIWFGTVKNGLYSFNRFSNEFRNYNFDTKDNSVRVNGLYEDGLGTIWFGPKTRGLGKFNADRGLYHLYSHDPNDSTTISHNDVVCILPDENDILWIGTWGGGLNRFDKKTGTFKRYTNDSNNPQSLSHDHVTCIYKDRTGKLWIGTNGGGLNLLNQTDGSFKSFNLLGKTAVASIMAIHEDRQGNFWIGTYTSGIHLFDRDKEISVYNITEEDGLANILAWTILEDDSGNLWIGTDNGLSRFDPKTHSIKNYFTSDGLEGNRYWWGSSSKTSTGEMLFGTWDGFTIFHPDNIKDDPYPPQVVISNVSLFNRPGEKLTFDGFISELDELELSYNENDLRFDYVGMQFGEPVKNKYKYMLENFDDNWVDAGMQRNATYTNLDAGEYAFRVTACNRDGVWNEEGASIKIIILPPWWATTWAYLIYVLILLSIIYFTWRLQLKRIRIKHDYEMSKFEAEKMHEVDEMKSRFFANISHEFRTPLTLIFGPAKDVIEKTKEIDTKQSVGIIKRNASRLYGLVNQLLDLSKLEAGRMTLGASEQNIMPLLKGLVLSFTSLAERKKITLQFNTIEENLNVYIDKDKVEKIITNLLSNAFKFTPEGGNVDITVEKLIKDVEIRIADNGIGISKERIDKIFDRFFQVDGSHTRESEGTGIGLALTKELVELHKGKIKVESIEGEGTTLTVLLPLGKDHLKQEEIIEQEIIKETPATIDETEFITGAENRKEKTDIDLLLETDKPLLLIVEDNSDVRQYIISHLERDYRIQEAVDGEDGLEQALNHIPDLIISDVMMPKMDGFELCNKLKTDEKTSHIPIIMLTAKATSKDKIEGYETGADDYIMKPFDAAELKVRIKNLIEIRRKLQEKFSSDDFVIPKGLSSIDEQFMKRVLQVINEHISEEDFSIEELGTEAAMSRWQIYKKIKALTGRSPSILIRSVRLVKSKKMIKDHKGTISEIAYSVGFSSPAYFSKCFSEEFGYPPSEL
jgi:signal transduction histidine kinase/ligand-binding sensor domain-containing protein/DNA-binding response OmpR family regulator